MRNSKLILVEGMPGTGKSTTSQLITLQMRAQGLASKWYPEEHQSRPVQWYYYPERYPSFADYTEEVISRWRAYAIQLQDGQRVNVLDAAILQNHVRSLMIFNCSLPTILELVAGIESQIAALNPLFIYLYPRNIDDNFREVIAVRGSRMLDLWIKAHDQYPYSRKSQLSGRAGFLAFWNEFGRTSD